MKKLKLHFGEELSRYEVFTFLKFDRLYFIVVMSMNASTALYILKVTKSHKIIFIHHQMHLTRRVIYDVQPWRDQKI